MAVRHSGTSRSRQDHRHRLGMDGLHDGIRLGRQEAVDQIAARGSASTGAMVAVERGPDTSRTRIAVGPR